MAGFGFSSIRAPFFEEEDMSGRDQTTRRPITRRRFLKGSAGVAAGTAAAGAADARAPVVAADAKALPKKAVVRGRIRQSIVFWCFNASGDKWDVQRQCQIAVALGCKSLELVEPSDFPTLKKYGLVSAISPNGMPGAPFAKGLNNLKYHDEVIACTRKTIDAVAEAKFPGVIAFTGYKWRNADDPQSGEIPLDEGAKNCVAGLKKLASYAEKKGVTVSLEMLNTRDSSHPMKGHPEYQGDHIDYVCDIARQVGSPRVKVLFDLYHVQIMDGDLIRRIRQHAEWIGHVHTAGNPDRAELDDRQEINFPACMKALLEVGYTGFVGHEFIPTRDPMQGLIEAVRLCDV
jgi:sugar phosphate isomerase/epimerase